jgi:cephalosporin-C deacetylase-like acetyl esterase
LLPPMRTIISLLFLATSALSQTTDQWDFLSTASIFPDVHGMLPAYLKAKADALLEQRRQTVARISSMQDLKARQQYWRERMWADLGGQPERTPLNARTVGMLDRGDYRIEKIIFESRPGFYVTANLYVPKQGKPPYPAILYPLGHEEGAKAHSAWQRTLVNLTRRGFVCLTWDPIGQGERVQFYDQDFHDSKLQASTTEHTMLGMQCLLTGSHVAQYTIWDGIRALDYLLSRPEVDAKRVGCTGNSGGGTHTAYISGLDDRVQVAAPSCYITSWRRMLESIGPQDAEQVFPFWLKDGFDYADFIYASGGKPFLILAAIRDFFPIGGARATYEEVRQTYGKLGLAGHIAIFEADDGHGYTKPRRERANRWFSRWLEDQENTDPETPVQLLSEQELQCTQTGQVSTSFPGAADVYSLNRQRAEGLRADRKATPDVVRARAAELTQYQPPQGTVHVTSYGQIAHPRLKIEKLTYESEPGISVPALLFIPETGTSRKRSMILVNPRGKAASAKEAEALAADGNVVLVPDLRGFGETQPMSERRETSIRNFGDYGDSMTALLVGKTMTGMRALDVIRAVDVLVSRGEVDPSGITVAGRGVAAMPVLYAALFDSRISRVALDGMLTSYESVVSERLSRGIVEEIVPSVLRYFDIPDIVAAIAPRHVLILNGVNPLGQKSTPEHLRDEYAMSLTAYKAQGAGSALQISVVNEEEQPFSAVLQQWLRQ